MKTHQIPGKVRSYADPCGQVYLVGQRYGRSVEAPLAQWLKRMIALDFYQKGIAQGHLLDLAIDEFPVNGRHTVSTTAIAPVTYPWEWCPLQLADAGLLTVDLALAAFESGLVLKDAQARNVVFSNGRPVFVDYGSFTPYCGERVWHARGQFDRQFILPLLAYLHRGLLPSHLLRMHGDGLAPVSAARILGFSRWSGIAEIETCALPALSSKGLQSATGLELKQDSEILPLDKAVYLGLLRRARKLLESVRARVQRSQQGRWGDYGDGGFHYGAHELEQKKTWLLDQLSRLSPTTVIDIGANTGTFSKLFASHGAQVVAVESDVDAVSRLYENVRATRQPITPVFMDVCAPTPSGGWNQDEFDGFNERVAGSADLVLALAVIHHVAVRGYGYVPFIDLIARSTRKHAVVEFIDPEDDMFSGMLKLHTLPADAYHLPSFFAAFKARFDVVDQLPIKSGKRILFLGKVRSGAVA